jgi:hypothetical protein
MYVAAPGDGRTPTHLQLRFSDKGYDKVGDKVGDKDFGPLLQHSSTPALQPPFHPSIPS